MRRALLLGCALLLALMPGLGAAQDDAFSWDRLLARDVDWGSPPADDDLAYPYEQLPLAAGWLRCFPRVSFDYANPVALVNGLLLVHIPGGLKALRLDSGEPAWTISCDSSQGAWRITGADGTIFNETRDGVEAICDADGGRLWQRDQLKLLGVAPGAVWAASYYGDNPPVYGRVELLSASSGETLREFDMPLDYRLYAVYTRPTDKLALEVKGGARVLYTDGRAVDIPLVEPDWEYRLGLAEDSLVVAERRGLIGIYAGVFSAEDGEDREAEAEPDLKSIVSCYELPSGQLRWRRTDLPDAYPRYSEPYFYCAAGCLALSTNDEVWVLNLSDGSERLHWIVQPQDSHGYGVAGVLGDGRSIAYLQTYTSGRTVWYSLELDGDAPPRQLTQPGSGLWPELAADGWLVCDAGRFPWGNGRQINAIAVLQVEPDGTLRPGTLKLEPPPVDYSGLRGRFCASPAPLAQPELMREVVAAGIDNLIQLLGAVSPANANQLDALFAAAVYMHLTQVPDTRNVQQVALFFSRIEQERNPAYTPAILRWLATPVLASEPEDALTALAFSGGPQAREYLCARYDKMDVTRHEQPAGPYKLVVPDIPDDDDARRIARAGLLVEASPEQLPPRYALLPLPGLWTERDLYVARDSDGDGLWDWVLPTGLQDNFFSRQTMMTRFYGTESLPRLDFSVADGYVRITHRETDPRLDPAWDFEHPFRRVTTTVATVTTELPLGRLLADSDGDGLTDIAERLLFTDPRRADTDGDGIGDAEDATPNANPARMGRLERGIARALRYYFAEHWYDGGWWKPGAQSPWGLYAKGNPWSARYFLPINCGPVAFSGNPRTYGVCLNTTDQQDKYAEGQDGFLRADTLTIGWKLRGLSDEEAFSQSSLSTEMSFAEYRRRFTKWTSSTGFLDDDSYTWADLKVGINHPMEGYAVLLVDVDGEYIPVGWGGSWVGD